MQDFYLNQEQNPHHFMAKNCMTVLSFPAAEDDESPLRDLLGYSATFWPIHAEKITGNSPSYFEIEQYLVVLAGIDTNLEGLVQWGPGLFGRSKPVLASWTRFHIAALFNWIHALKEMLEIDRSEPGAQHLVSGH